MKCSPELLDALLDDELGAAETSALQQHLEACPECSAAYARLRRLKAGIKAAAPYYSAPPELRRSVREALERETVRQTPWRGIAIAASLLLAASLVWNLVQLRPRRGADEMASAVLADHIRSLLGNSPVDVASSDQHTVKPWFAGKLDFSPPVRDLAAEGFPLVGGRIDYLNERRARLPQTSARDHGVHLARRVDGRKRREEPLA